MLARYQIIRGKRPPSDPLPDGVRQDTRKHTHHILRPEPQAVARYLEDPSDARWREFRDTYEQTLAERLRRDRSAFEALAQLATTTDVYLGCNCPTAKVPDVKHCHTTLALRFMKRHFGHLDVHLPG